MQAIEEKYDEMHSLLKEHVLSVKFRKMNGEVRDMECTLKPDLIKIKSMNDVSKRTVKINKNVVRVFDLIKQEWRSFRIDSILETKLL